MTKTGQVSEIGTFKSQIMPYLHPCACPGYTEDGTRVPCTEDLMDHD